MSSDFITERELKAHLEPMKDDIHEIKLDVKSLVSAQYTNSWFGGKGQMMLVALVPALIAAAVALAIAIYF